VIGRGASILTGSGRGVSILTGSGLGVFSITLIINETKKGKKRNFIRGGVGVKVIDDVD